MVMSSQVSLVSHNILISLIVSSVLPGVSISDTLPVICETIPFACQWHSSEQ